MQDVQIDTSDPNIYIDVFNISIKPNIMAWVSYQIAKRTGGAEKKDIVITGDDYRRWTQDDRYLFIYICNLHGLSYVERIEPEFIEKEYVLQNEDGSFRCVKEMRKNPKYTGLPPLVVSYENIMNNE